MGDECVQQCFCLWRYRQRQNGEFHLPNLLNHHECCYVVTDTKGELLRRTGKGFEEDGYEVTVLDTVNPEQSAGYDPLRYVMDVEDIPTTVAAIMEGVDPDGRSLRYDPFWNNASDLLLRAIVGILFLLETLAGTLTPGEDPNAPRRYLKMNTSLNWLRSSGLREMVRGDSRWTTL